MALENPFQVFTSIELAIMCFSFGCLLIVFIPGPYLGNPSGDTLFKALFLLLLFISGWLVGAQFPLANKLYLGNETSITQTAGLLYSADLLGGWVGGILGAVVLLPILGLVNTCIAVGLIKLTSLIAISTRPRPHFQGG